MTPRTVLTVLCLSAPALPAAGATTYTFVRVDYDTLVSEPIGLAAADFNEDGRPDLVATGFSGQAGVLINTGTGFAANPPVPLGGFGTPFWIAAADFDDDGHQDAIVAPIGTSELVWLRGNGLGGLITPGTQLAVGQSPIHVTAVDLDLDGRDDLIAANAGDAFLTVLYGGGPRLDLAVPFESHTTAVRDFDEDGRLDIAVSFANGAEEVGLLRATGPRSFSPYQQIGIDLGYHMAAGDFDGDGHADLVTAPLFLADVWVLRGTGTGSFNLQIADSPGNLQNDVRTGDLDCDGLDDAVVVGGGLSIVLSGDPALGLVRNRTVTSGPNSDTAAFADYDGDGVTDIAFPNMITVGKAAVLTNTTVLLTCPPDQTIDPGPSCLVDLAATSCDTTLLIDSQPPLPANLPVGVHTIVFTATDPAGQTATCSTTISVIDTTAPVLNGVPADETVACDAVPPPADPTATDCDPDVDITFDETRIDGSCADSYTLVRTWTASDSSGNQSSATQIVTVQDLVGPVVAGCALRLEPPLAPPAPPLAAPLAPQAPRSPASGCSGPSSARVRVDCGLASDNCDPGPQVVARVILTRTEPSGTGCTIVTDEIPVACDELLELVRLPPACAGRPRPPRPPVEASSNGVRRLSGERIVLEVTGRDRCGNIGQPCSDDATAPGGALPCPPRPPRCPRSACDL